MQETSSLSNILTQEEIDALLNPEAQKEKNNPLELLKTAQPPKKYPVLEKNMDAFCRALTTSLHQLTQSENIRVDIQSFIFGQLGAYLDTLPTPSMLGFYQVEEWRQSVLISMDFNLSYCLLDMTLGGRRGTPAMTMEGRAYTPIEKGIIQKILKSFTNDFDKSFHQNFVFENMDTNPKTALIASPACDIVISRLEVVLDKRKGIMDVILPAHLLNQIDAFADENEKQAEFGELLALAVAQVPLELKAVLDKKQIPLGQVTKWKVGDMLPLSYFEDKPIELDCENQALFKASLKVVKKSISVQIEKVLSEDI